MRTRGVSLVELVVAVVILGLLAALAIPRLSRAAPHDPASTLRTDLAILRTAIQLYYQDHDAYPGEKSAGEGAGPGTSAAVIRQLTQYTDRDGLAAASPSDRYRYGPYLRDGIPPCPVSAALTSAVHVIRGPGVPRYEEAAQQAGWVYNYETGYIAANSPDADARGIRYDAY